MPQTATDQTTELKPTDIMLYAEIEDKRLCQMANVSQPNYYGWYLKDGLYYPHRKPTTQEWRNNKFSEA